MTTKTDVKQGATILEAKNDMLAYFEYDGKTYTGGVHKSRRGWERVGFNADSGTSFPYDSKKFSSKSEAWGTLPEYIKRAAGLGVR